MRLRHVEIFHSLMQTRSVTRTAALLHTSQPTASRYLGEIEREIGFALFQRTGGRLVPTPEAAALWVEVERSFAGLERIAEVARGIAEFRHDRLRIASISSFALGCLARVLPGLRARLRHVEIFVHVGTFEDVVANTLADQCEIGFVAYPVDNPGLTEIPLVRADALCALPAGHRLAALERVGIADLAGEPMIALFHEVPSGRRVAELFDQAGVARTTVLETQNAAIACAFVKAGMGVAILDPFTITSQLDARMLARPFVPGITFAFSAILRADRPLPRICRQLIDAIAAVPGLPAAR